MDQEDNRKYPVYRWAPGANPANLWYRTGAFGRFDADASLDIEVLIRDAGTQGGVVHPCREHEFLHHRSARIGVFDPTETVDGGVARTCCS